MYYISKCVLEKSFEAVGISLSLSTSSLCLFLSCNPLQFLVCLYECALSRFHLSCNFASLTGLSAPFMTTSDEEPQTTDSVLRLMTVPDYSCHQEQHTVIGV